MILSLVLSLSVAPQVASDPAAALAARVRGFVDAEAAADRFSGTVLIAKGSEEALAGAWGLADRKKEVSNTLDTRFNLGSISKLFGRILEVLAERDYYEHVREVVFEPSGMRRTAWLALDAEIEDRAVGYTPPENGRRRDGASQNPVRGSPAGGTFSTARDLLAFTRALRDGTLLRPETLALFTSRQVDLKPGVGYGFLCIVFGAGRRRCFGHDGGSAGVNAELWVYPELDLTFAVLANYEGAADTVAGFIHGEIGKL